jgi:hypothetical protein
MKKFLDRVRPNNIHNVHLRRLSIICHLPVAFIVLIFYTIKTAILEVKGCLCGVTGRITKLWDKDYKPK